MVDLVAELHANAAYMRGELTRRGFDLGTSDTHIMPVMVRDDRGVLAPMMKLLATPWVAR